MFKYPVLLFDITRIQKSKSESVTAPKSDFSIALCGFNVELYPIYPGYELRYIKTVKEAVSRVEYACKINFDPLARRYLFSGYSLTTFSKVTLIHFRIAEINELERVAKFIFRTP